jgi:predicted metal-binding membrane protein
MAGMDAGPGTDLGTVGWFSGVWTVMMAAMMLPSFALTTAFYAAMTVRREGSRWLLFTAGYLLVWSAAGIAAYGLFALGHSLLAFALGHSLLAAELAWHRGGRWVTPVWCSPPRCTR